MDMLAFAVGMTYLWVSSVTVEQSNQVQRFYLQRNKETSSTTEETTRMENLLTEVLRYV